MQYLIIALLTLLNGFFALSEIALVSTKKSKMEHLAHKGNKHAKIVLELLENPENFLSSVQVGITLIGIIAGAYGGSVIASSSRVPPKGVSASTWWKYVLPIFFGWNPTWQKRLTGLGVMWTFYYSIL